MRFFRGCGEPPPPPKAGVIGSNKFLNSPKI